MRLGIWALALTGSGLMLSTASAALLDFQAAGQYAANFRTLEQEAGVTLTQNAGGFIRATSVSTVSRISTVYDTTPGDGAATKTSFGLNTRVELDARLADTTRSLGIYLIDAATPENTAYLALFNVDTSGSTDQIRFSATANPTSASNNAAGLETSGSLTGNAGYNASTSTFVHMKLDYTADLNNHPVLTFTVGDFSRTITYSSLTAYSQVEVGLRFSPQTSGNRTIDVDNFSVGAIPEPASLSLMALGAVGLITRRRRA